MKDTAPFLHRAGREESRRCGDAAGQDAHRIFPCLDDFMEALMISWKLAVIL
jgi:hypothetical protein